MDITRGLIIADPWIGYILDGTKTWEMRSTSTSHRGWFGLIRKGSGQVFGFARLIGCGEPLTQAEMIAAHDHHRIPEGMIRSGSVKKWTVPWKLAEVRVFSEPVPYVHKSGAVTWVNFDPEVRTVLARLFLGTCATPDRELEREIEADGSFPTSESRERLFPIEKANRVSRFEKRERSSSPNMPQSADILVGKSVLSGGNIRNNHFYLTEFLHRFPVDCIGGANKASPKQIFIDWGGPTPVHTDIDQTKRVFRARGWVGNFFASTNAVEGDTVVVERSGSHSYRVRLDKTASK